MEKLVFYFFAGLLLVAAAMVVSLRNPVHAVLSLVVAFFASAGLWLLAEAEFLAIVLILVYVGAVMVLFLFVVMMLDINVATMREGFMRFLPVGVLISAAVAGAMVVAVRQAAPGVVAAGAGENVDNTVELGRVLYTVYFYPFEIAAVLLLVAMVAAIALTHRGPRSTKTQDPGKQVRVRREDRVRLVKD